jgi:hypothetical protein
MGEEAFQPSQAEDRRENDICQTSEWVFDCPLFDPTQSFLGSLLAICADILAISIVQKDSVEQREADGQTGSHRNARVPKSYKKVKRAQSLSEMDDRASGCSGLIDGPSIRATGPIEAF